jgi:hypothetical protein
MPPGTTAGTSMLPFAFLTVHVLPTKEESRLCIAVSPSVEVQRNAAISVVVLIMVVLQQTLKHTDSFSFICCYMGLELILAEKIQKIKNTYKKYKTSVTSLS